VEFPASAQAATAAPVGGARVVHAGLEQVRARLEPRHAPLTVVLRAFARCRVWGL